VGAFRTIGGCHLRRARAPRVEEEEERSETMSKTTTAVTTAGKDSRGFFRILNGDRSFRRRAVVEAGGNEARRRASTEKGTRRRLLEGESATKENA